MLKTGSRKRLALTIGGGVLALAALAVGLSYALAGGDEPIAQPSPNLTPSGGAQTPSPSPSPSASAAPWYGEYIATSAVEELTVWGEPGGSDVVAKLGEWSPTGTQPLTLLGTETATVDGSDWLHVSLPAKPNGQNGWVAADDITLSSTTVEVHIYLDEHRLEVLDGGTAVFEAPVAIGTAETPTPVGVFYVTDPIGPFANATGVYGAYAIGISAFSDVLDEFYGGPPQVALHGTNEPELIGQSVSNGCIRMANDDVLALADLVDLGTPVIVHGSVAG